MPAKIADKINQYASVNRLQFKSWYSTRSLNLANPRGVELGLPQPGTSRMFKSGETRLSMTFVLDQTDCRAVTAAKGLFIWANISTSTTSLLQGQSYNEKN